MFSKPPCRLLALTACYALTVTAAAAAQTLLLAPPTGGVGTDGRVWRDQVEQKLTQRFATHAGLRILAGPQRQGLLQRLETAHGQGSAFIAAHLLDARWVLTSRLILRPGLPDVRLDLRDAMSGEVLQEAHASLRDDKTFDAAVQSLAGACIAPAAQNPAPATVWIGLAPIALRSGQWHADSDPVPDMLRVELLRRLLAIPNARFLDADLAGFLLQESAHLKTMPDAPAHAIHQDILLVGGELTTETAPGSAYEIRLTLKRGTKEVTADTRGKRPDFPSLHEQAGDALMAAAATLGTPAASKADPATREKLQVARQRLQQAATAIPDAWRTNETEIAAAVEAVNAAASLLPESPEPYLAVRRALVNPRLAGEAHGAPLIALREAMLQHFPDVPGWEEVACQQVRALRTARRSNEELNTAKSLASALLQGRCHVPQQARDHAAIETLVRQGENQLAFHYALATITDTPPNQTSALEILATQEWDAGHTLYALNALKSLAVHFPGREEAWLGKDNRSQKVLGTELGEWFKPILATRGQTQKSLPTPAEFTTWPPLAVELVKPIPNPPDISRFPLPPNTTLLRLASCKQLHALVTMADASLAVWSPTVGTLTPVTGMPQKGATDLQHLRFMSAAGRLFISWSNFGLWEIDPATGQAASIILPDLRDVRVQVAWDADGTIFLGGSAAPPETPPTESHSQAQGLSFVAVRRAGEDTFRITMGPPQTGGICDVSRTAPANSVTLLHRGSRHLTRLDMKSLKWTVLSPATEAFHDDHFTQVACRPAAVITLSADTLNAVPMKLTDPAGIAWQNLYYVPAPNGHSGVHQWFWQRRGEAGAVPVTSPPVDMADDGKWFWILSSDGTVAGSEDAQHFAGPFKIAEAAISLEVCDGVLYVGSRTAVVGVALADLQQAAAAEGVLRTRVQVYAQTQAALEQWCATMPPLGRGAYLDTTAHRPDLAADYFRDSPLSKTPAGALAAASTLAKAGRDADAVAILRPHVADPSSIRVRDIEARLLNALQQSQQWDEILELIPRLWKQSPLRGELVPYDERFYSWHEAVMRRQPADEVEKTLWDMLSGGLPHAAWSWTEDASARHIAKELRENAARSLMYHLAERRAFQTILDHPQLGAKAWDDRGGGTAAQLYLAAGQAENALAAAQNPGQRAQILVMLGRFDEALALRDQPGTRLSWIRDSLIQAAMFQGTWDIYDPLVQTSLADAADPNEEHELVRLLRKAPPAATALIAAQKAEFLRQPADALAAYRTCAQEHPGSLAGAEALFRLAELAWLGSEAADHKTAFASAQAAMTTLAQGNDQAVAAWAIFRLGIIQRVYHDDPAAAAELWKKGQALDGHGATLCRQSLVAQTQEPLIAAGDTQEPPPARLATIHLGKENLVLRFLDGRRYDFRCLLYSPVNGGSRGGDWHEPTRWWKYFLWYPCASYRPGIGWIRVVRDGKTDLVWLKLVSR